MVKTADGAEETVKYTAKTTVRGAKEGAHMTALAGKEGAHVVVHYSVASARKTASAVDYIGHGAVKVEEGTLVSVDKGTRVAVMKTADGAEDVFHLSERMAIETKDGAVNVAKFTGRQGDRFLIHYPEKAGRKTVHFLKQL